MQQNHIFSQIWVYTKTSKMKLVIGGFPSQNSFQRVISASLRLHHVVVHVVRHSSPGTLAEGQQSSHTIHVRLLAGAYFASHKSLNVILTRHRRALQHILENLESFLNHITVARWGSVGPVSEYVRAFLLLKHSTESSGVLSFGRRGR